MHVNLLPSTFIWGRLVMRRIRQWGCVYGVLALAMLCWNATLIGNWWNCHCNFQAIQEAAEPIRQLQVDRIQLAKQSMALEQKIKQLRSCVSHDRTTSLLGIVADGVRSADVAVQIQEMQVTFNCRTNDSTNQMTEAQRRTQVTQIPTTESKPIHNECQLMLRGIALNSESITAFIESLQRSTVFPSI